MSTWSRLIGSTSLNLAGYLYLLGASVVSISLLARGLSLSALSAYVILAAVPPFISIFDLGMPQAVIRALSQTEGGELRRVRVNSYGFFLATLPLIGLLTWLVLLILGRAPVVSAALTTPIILSLVGCAMTNHLLNHFLAIAQAELRFGIYNIKSWLVGTVNTLGAGLLALWTGDLTLIFVVLFAAYLLTLVTVVYSLDRGRYAVERIALSRPVLSRLLHYGLQNFLGTLSGQVELHAGKYILSFLPPLFVSAFTIPQNVVYKLGGALSQGTLALFPLGSRLAHPDKRSELRRLYYQLQALILGGSLLFILIVALWGQPLLTLWLGAGELAQAAYPVLRLLSYFFVLMSLTPVASVVVNALGYPLYTSLSAVATAALNLLLLGLLTPSGGALGAAQAILVSSAVTTPVFLYLTERVLQDNKIQY